MLVLGVEYPAGATNAEQFPVVGFIHTRKRVGFRLESLVTQFKPPDVNVPVEF